MVDTLSSQLWSPRPWQHAHARAHYDCVHAAMRARCLPNQATAQCMTRSLKSCPESSSGRLGAGAVQTGATGSSGRGQEQLKPAWGQGQLRSGARTAQASGRSSSRRGQEQLSPGTEVAQSMYRNSSCRRKEQLRPGAGATGPRQEQLRPGGRSSPGRGAGTAQAGEGGTHVG